MFGFGATLSFCLTHGAEKLRRTLLVPLVLSLLLWLSIACAEFVPLALCVCAKTSALAVPQNPTFCRGICDDRRQCL